MPAKPSVPIRQEWCLPSECDDCRLLADSQRTMHLFKTGLSRRTSLARASKNYSASSKASSFVSVQSISTKELDPSSDDTSTMSSAGASPVSRPRSSKSNNAAPSGPFCIRRPTLKEILEDTAPPPWNLANFVEYASNNLCLENIEFVQDATRYRDLYDQIFASASTSYADDNASISSGQQDQLKERWTRIILNYIAPSSPKEVNIPGDIRSALAKISVADEPAHPRHLQPAIRKIVELIEDSILFPFLHEWKPAEIFSSDEGQPYGDSSSKRRSIPALDHVTSASVSFSAPTQTVRPRRQPATNHFSNISTAFSRPVSTASSSRGHLASPTDNEGMYSSYTEFTDDLSGLASSHSIQSPISTREHSSTPPATPPASTYEESQGWKASPRNKTNEGWKKMTKLFRKRSGGSVRSSSHPNPGSIREE